MTIKHHLLGDEGSEAKVPIVGVFSRTTHYKQYITT